MLVRSRGVLERRLKKMVTMHATTIRFCRYELRTSDVAAARAFYDALIGGIGADIVQLPEQAAARGARPHWLGHLGVDDVERAAQAFVERGATRLGPTRPLADGCGEIAVVRDPGGAVVAVATPPSAPPRTPVVWHGLNTNDLARATASYCELFGWRMTDRLDLGPLGVFHQFTWHPDERSVGAIVDTAGRPGVHAHWLFQFPIAALDPALTLVRAAGGIVVGLFTLPTGERLAVCDDPQGAAFALRERPRPPGLAAS